MLSFEPLELRHIPLVAPYFSYQCARICDCTVGSVFMWREYFRTAFAIEDDTLFFRVTYTDGNIAYPFPLGPDPARGLTRLRQHCQESGEPFQMCTVPRAGLELCQKLFPDCKATAQRDWFDYLYTREDLAFFKGRRYSGQRNHINRFLKQFPEWSYTIIGPDTLSQAREYLISFAAERGKDDQLAQEEMDKVLEVMDHFDAYGMVGGLLKVGDTIVGLSLGEIVGDTLFVHIEKALREYPGAYQMLVSQFARTFGDESTQYVNREEDVGDEGLRTSKLSYHPIELLEKYTVAIPLKTSAEHPSATAEPALV